MTISILIHSLLLWPVARPHPSGQAAPAPLAATLRPAVLPETPRIPPNEAAPVPRRAAVPQRAAVAATELPVMKAPGPAPAPPAPAAPGETAAPPPTGGAGIPVREVLPDAEEIRGYRIGLAREARGRRRYPSLALERGWSGTVEVVVGITRQGRAREVQLARSSGHEILDREALAMMSHAAAAVEPPDSLRGREFSVRLPVVFDLSEENRP